MKRFTYVSQIETLQRRRVYDDTNNLRCLDPIPCMQLFLIVLLSALATLKSDCSMNLRKRTKASDERCPYCLELALPLEQRNSFVVATAPCPQCAAMHHVACAVEHGGCAACGWREAGAPLGRESPTERDLIDSVGCCSLCAHPLSEPSACSGPHVRLKGQVYSTEKHPGRLLCANCNLPVGEARRSSKLCYSCWSQDKNRPFATASEMADFLIWTIAGVIILIAFYFLIL